MIGPERRLIAAFELVTEELLPGWGERLEWSVEPAETLCFESVDVETKTLRIITESENDDALTLWLIPNVCTAALLESYGGNWPALVEGIRRNAKRTGRKRLVRMIECLLSEWLNDGSGRISPRAVYDCIEACVLTNPQTGFLHVIEDAAARLWLFPLWMLGEYPRCEDVFRSAENGDFRRTLKRYREPCLRGPGLPSEVRKLHREAYSSALEEARELELQREMEMKHRGL